MGNGVDGNRIRLSRLSCQHRGSSPVLAVSRPPTDGTHIGERRRKPVYSGGMVGSRTGTSWSRRRRVLGGLALGLYGLLIAVSPALHHDLACHVKSPAHCDACVANSPASRAEPRA